MVKYFSVLVNKLVGDNTNEGEGGSHQLETGGVICHRRFNL